MGKQQQLLASIIVGSILAWCSAVIAADSSAPATPVTTAKPGTLGLIVSGASSGIQTDYFEQTAAEAIAASELFSSVDTSRAAAEIIMPMLTAKGVFPSTELSHKTPYFLEIRVIRVDAPSFSISMTVEMKTVWTLHRTADRTTLMHEVITSTYTGGAFEGGIIGANRVRAGTEGAARENIRIGLDMLQALDLNMDKAVAETLSEQNVN